MSDRSDGQREGSYQRTTRRFWRRRETPAGWWPWGLIPLLGLVGLWLIGALLIAPAMESDIETGVASALSEFKADVSADGQHVRVVAEAPESKRVWITALARSTACDTWLSDTVCPIAVDVTLTEPSAASAPTTAIAGRLHDFTLEKADSGVTLSGEVATDTDRTDAIDRAAALADSLTDNLTVADDVAHPEDALAMRRAADVLRQLERGVAQWQDGRFSVRGWVSASDEDAVRAAFRNPDDAPTLGDLTLQVTEVVDACNAQFDDALANSTIRFATGSATISTSSEPLLNALANIASTCPGQLVIEGHTDNVGDAASNQTLSDARANAVRQALISRDVDGERLRAVGYGESRPAATNDTPAGRARNRRIVIRIGDLRPIDRQDQ